MSRKESVRTIALCWYNIDYISLESHTMTTVALREIAFEIEEMSSSQPKGLVESQ